MEPGSGGVADDGSRSVGLADVDHRSVPVCLFVFNRPETTREVFEQIRAAEPKRLYVVADGPRPGHPEDQKRCEETRAVTESVDWDCEVRREYADENLGLKRRFVTGLDVLFGHEKRGIVLEDDCVPNQDFFRFCATMLDQYADDERVWDISGSNHLETWRPDRQEYHFSYYGGIWGWATWRRCWEAYDPEMRLWGQPEVRDRLRDVVASESQYAYLETVYDRVHAGDIETWDYQWGFARQINSGLSVVPSQNLVSNIGFGDDATNTTEDNTGWAELTRHDLADDIRIHDYVAVDREYDRAFHRLRTDWWERVPRVRRAVDRILRQ